MAVHIEANSVADSVAHFGKRRSMLGVAELDTSYWKNTPFHALFKFTGNKSTRLVPLCNDPPRSFYLLSIQLSFLSKQRRRYMPPWNC